MENDSELIERIKKGETALYEQLMRKYNQRLYRIARSMIREEMEVEDILQETYLKAFLHLKTFEGRSEFSTWLTSILLNQANASLMKKKKQQRMTSEENYSSESLLNMEAPQQDNPEQQIMNQELKKYLEKAIDELPDKLRTVYMMREIEGLAISETAEILQLSPENVRVRLHRAKALLKEKLYKEAKAETTVFRFGEERCDKLVRSVMQQLDKLYPFLNKEALSKEVTE